MLLNGKEIASRSVRTLMDAGLVYLTEDRKSKGLMLEEKLGPNLTLQALDAVNPGFVLDKRAEFDWLEKQ
ncbi:hypothetical protein HED49_18490 [Ochrobactrum daejeonense]|nr:hypothetical protein [Brucella daejeonensis]